MTGSYGKYVFNFARDFQTAFQTALYHFTLSPAMCENFSCSSSLAMFGIASLLNCNLYSGHEVISHCGFNTHFPND